MKDKVKKYLKELECDDVDWNRVAQGTDLVNMVMNLRVPESRELPDNPSNNQVLKIVSVPRS
jgi:hypothetical protein